MIKLVEAKSMVNCKTAVQDKHFYTRGGIIITLDDACLTHLFKHAYVGSTEMKFLMNSSL